ncbi:hypothetical protein B4N84_07790 [Flavobacterium sp. IR1]|nr:hypothetical protein B4N84_07790 [Flavobacterium sp. IR1]
MYLILFAPKIWQSDELLSQLSILLVLWQNRTDLKKLTCNQAKLKISYKFTSIPNGTSKPKSLCHSKTASASSKPISSNPP